jgi:hypothetical protein
MLEYQLHLSVNRAVAEGLIQKSSKDANLLFGWQVRVSAHMQDEGKGTLPSIGYYSATAVTPFEAAVPCTACAVETEHVLLHRV